MINSILVKSELGCEASCFGDDNCMSMNIGLLEDGKHVCELSSSDHDIHPKDLKDQIDFIYRPVLVSNQRILIIIMIIIIIILIMLIINSKAINQL